MKLEFSRQVFERNSNIKVHENSFSGSLVVPRGRTDGHGQANSRFSHFCGSALEAVIKKIEIRALNIAVQCYRSFVMFKTQRPHGYSGRDYISVCRQNASITSLLLPSTYCPSYQGLILLINAEPSGRAFYCRTHVRIDGSNPARGMDVCIAWKLFVVR